MEPQHWIMIALFIAAAVLPGVGLFGVYQASRRFRANYGQAPKTSDQTQMTFGQLNVITKSLHKKMENAALYALRDFVLIGSGLVLGATASIWAVIDSALTISA